MSLFNYVEYKHNCSNCGIPLSGFRSQHELGTMGVVPVKEVSGFSAKCHDCGFVHQFTTVREIVLKDVVLREARPADPVEHRPPPEPGSEQAKPQAAGNPVLTDTSPMPFGKYQGKALGDLDASYLRWMWNNGFKDKPNDPLGEYIKRNKTGLMSDDKDGIWDE